ncbi:hypothetical protein ACA538_003201 [Proteus mirabilis]|uniref:tail fiber/spike domain-containing protein n=1 Tax=Proteus mirabilis TaxID=584 RepID=UPI001A2786D8|nr:hypothetical protein [Proteus mirabilis]EKT8414604.1 hypothetical protein [Proteus mirabilis]EKU7618291.1 hypothetical protein [Proteus mirabilis]ELT7776749.1 hypothetical protein [Proteus mirabilis]MBI6491850.1 hypothetical protein [Proteus mirabilis]MCT8196124.1 hypothetical protein [Proteus mirabilis]
MSTIPTQNPVPSEAPRDLKFNSGKIDEFVTSMKNKYIDRFGQEHFTIEGLRWIAQQAISQFGYITLDSFQKGAEITLPNQVLRDEVTGEYYRWDGELPKIVQIDSTPDNSGGIGAGKWLSVGDTSLRNELKKPTGSDLVGYNNGTLTKYIEENNRHTAKTIINVSAFGNTGTEQNGSDEAINAAFSYAISIATDYTNQLGQGPWYDLSGFVFVSDNPIYPKTSIKLRGFIGADFAFNTILPDDFDKELGSGYAFDFSKPGVSSRSSRPMFFKLSGGVNCRYVASGVYINDFLHFSINCAIKYYLNVGVETGASGNELFLTDGCVIMQRDYATTGDDSFPANVVSGYGVICRSGDCKIMGAIISYYKSIGITATGNGMYLGGGSHIYAGGKCAFYQGESDGLYHVIDGANFDSSRVTLLRGYTIMRNCNVGLYPNTDSSLGVIIGKNAQNIKITGNQFIGGAGSTTSNTTPIYWNGGNLSNKTCATFMNQFLGAISNSDVVDRTGALLVRGASTSGTISMDSGNVCKCRYDGEIVTFEMKVKWSNFTGGTGDLEIYGLPFVANNITPCATVQFTNNTNFSGVIAVKNTTNTSLKLVKPSGENIKASDAGVDSGYLCISGSYRPY